MALVDEAVLRSLSRHEGDIHVVGLLVNSRARECLLRASSAPQADAAQSLLCHSLSVDPVTALATLYLWPRSDPIAEGGRALSDALGAKGPSMDLECVRMLRALRGAKGLAVAEVTSSSRHVAALEKNVRSALALAGLAPSLDAFPLARLRSAHSRVVFALEACSGDGILGADCDDEVSEFDEAVSERSDVCLSVQAWLASAGAIRDTLATCSNIVDFAQSAMAPEDKLSGLLCSAAMPSAIDAYKSDLPPFYTKAVHEQSLSRAEAVLRDATAGTAVPRFLDLLRADVTSYWKAGRQLCDAVSMTGRGCVHQIHSGTPHSSGHRSIQACNCGRTLITREDPFTLDDANKALFHVPGCCDELENLAPEGADPSWSALALGSTSSALDSSACPFPRQDGFVPGLSALLFGGRSATGGVHVGFEYMCHLGHRFFPTADVLVCGATDFEVFGDGASTAASLAKQFRRRGRRRIMASQRAAIDLMHHWNLPLYLRCSSDQCSSTAQLLRVFYASPPSEALVTTPKVCFRTAEKAWTFSIGAPGALDACVAAIAPHIVGDTVRLTVRAAVDVLTALSSCLAASGVPCACSLAWECLSASVLAARAVGVLSQGSSQDTTSDAILQDIFGTATPRTRAVRHPASWGEVRHGPDPNAYTLRSMFGPVQIGAPPETIKYTIESKQVPRVYVLPLQLFAGWSADVEFPVYYAFFCLKAFSDPEKRLTIVGTTDQIERAKLILTESLFGPPPERIFTSEETSQRAKEAGYSVDLRAERDRLAFKVHGQEVPLDAYADFAYLERCGISKLVDKIILTHCHGDHDSGVLGMVLSGSRKTLYTTRTIHGSFSRKIKAVLGVDASDLYDFVPVRIQEDTLVNGATFTFDYNFHSIPTIGFETKYGGKKLSYSSDTKLDPALLAELVRDKVMVPAREAALRMRGFDADVIIHEMGVPPLHTEAGVLNNLPLDIKRKMAIVHCASIPTEIQVGDRVVKVTGLAKPKEGLENTLIIEMTPCNQGMAEASSVLKLLCSVPLLRGLDAVQVMTAFQSMKKEHCSLGSSIDAQGAALLVIQGRIKCDNLGTLSAGNCVGLSGPVSTVKAETDVVVGRFPINSITSRIPQGLPPSFREFFMGCVCQTEGMRGLGAVLTADCVLGEGTVESGHALALSETSVLFVREGTLEIRATSGTPPREVVLRRVCRGGIAGEGCLFDIKQWSGSALALEKSIVVHMRSDALQKAIRLCPAAYLKLRQSASALLRALHHNNSM
eukprot:m51a1_g5911 3',5'-cyclic-GMP phosphodiesterase, putative (1253) ;mRNA; f:10935-16478